MHACRSQLGEELHPVTATELRIDAHERMANQLNDIEISPTDYMLAYLHQRGWRLPDETLTLPNVLPEAESRGDVAEKPVWRIAFFSRLEERKGIKVFVEAVNQLIIRTARWSNFEVSGAESESSYRECGEVCGIFERLLFTQHAVKQIY